MHSSKSLGLLCRWTDLWPLRDKGSAAGWVIWDERTRWQDHNGLSHQVASLPAWKRNSLQEAAPLSCSPSPFPPYLTPCRVWASLCPHPPQKASALTPVGTAPLP